MAKSCEGCIHWRSMHRGHSIKCCHYLLDTGFPRNCPPEECLFYKGELEDMPKGHITPESTRQKVLEAVNAGERYTNIASTYNIGYNTVRRIVDAARHEGSPEAAQAPVEPVSEDKPAEVQYTKVTGCDGKYRSSENSAEKQEDTKPDYTPYEYAVDEAVLERMEKLRDRIAELQLDISNYENELECLDKYHLKYMETVKSG